MDEWTTLAGNALSRPDVRALLLVLGAGALAMLFVVTPLRSRHSDPHDPQHHAGLRRERELVYAMIRDLDHDFETGKLAAHDHDLIWPWPHDPPRAGFPRNYKTLFAHVRRRLLIPCALNLPPGVVTKQYRRTAITMVDEARSQSKRAIMLRIKRSDAMSFVAIPIRATRVIEGQ